MVDLLTVMRKEESRLLAASGKIGAKLSQITMSSNVRKPLAARVSKLRGKKLSAAHRAAITAAWAKRRKRNG
jgi:hypothetical protein